MKRSWTWMLLLIIIGYAVPALAADEPRFRVFWTLTGGATGALDKYRSDGVGTRDMRPLKTGDLALVINATDGPRFYAYNSASTETPDYLEMAPGAW